MLFNILTYIQLVALVFFWWHGTYIFFQNIYRRINQVIGIFFIAASSYFAFGALMIIAPSLAEYTLIFRIYVVGIFTAVSTIYHTSYLSLPKQVKTKQLPLLFVTYLGLGVLGYAALFTDWLYLTSQTLFDQFAGNWVFPAGPITFIPIIWGTGLCVLAGLNFAWLYLIAKKNTLERRMYILPTIANLVFYALAGIGAWIHFYHQPIPLWGIIFNGLIAAGTLLIAVSVIFYGLFLGDSLIKNRVFQYSSLALFIVILVYTIFVVLTGFSLNFNNTIFVIGLFLLLVTSHYAFDWINNFTRNLVYSGSVGFSAVTENEVAHVLRYYRRPSRLEGSPLTELKIVQRTLQEGKANNPVDGLRRFLKETIEHFNPEDEPHRRTRQNLKYHFLKMFAFDQAEEGQILWELGFEEYPTRILSQEDQGRKPKFITQSPADYTATSRNAFINLKQEAIHDVTWRISYLEKLARRS